MHFESSEWSEITNLLGVKCIPIRANVQRMHPDRAEMYPERADYAVIGKLQG